MNILMCILALFCMAVDQVEISQTADTLLYIRTLPSSAQIRLDGKPLGNSDGLFPVKPGTYKIVVDLEGYEPETQQISMRNGQITRIELELNRIVLSNSQKPDTNQTESAQSSKTVMLPDVDRRDCPTVLDLASGDLIENMARDGDVSRFGRLGKGDLWQDGGYFGTVRHARAMLWDGSQFTPFKAIRDDGSSIGYGKLTLPCRLLITTAERAHYDISILWIDGQGSARIDYRLAEPSIVPNTSNTDAASSIVPGPGNTEIIYQKAMATLHSIEAAIELYQLDTGQYPTTAQGLGALIRRLVSFEARGDWRGPYLKATSIPVDPWGIPYQYQYIETDHKPRVWSKGPDQISGTSDDIPPSEMLANRMKSATNLSGIGKAILIYANDHEDMLPTNLDALVSEVDLHPKLLVSPSKPEGFSGPDYVYVKDQNTNMHPKNVVAYENPAYCEDGLNVLYLDTHVAWEKRDDFLHALEATYKRLERLMPNIQFRDSDNTSPRGQ